MNIALSQHAPPARLAGFDEVADRMLPMARLRQQQDAVRDRYRAASPFPYAVLDGAFDPAVLDRIAAEFPSRGGRDWLSYDTANEIKQTSRGILGLTPFTQTFFWQLCSDPFMAWLREVTGFADLTVDPLFHGGGLHESYRGGWLNLHADWTKHPVLPLTRRLNLIIYLNRDWDESWGGALELWSPGAEKAGAKVAPLFNRAVIFPTTSETLHGFPDPMTNPPDRSRQSISMFYWSPDPEALAEAQFISFLPGSRKTRTKAALRSFIPPVAYTARDTLRGMLRGRKG